MTEPVRHTRRPWLPFAVVGAGVLVLVVFFSLVSSPDNAPPTMSKTFNLAGELRLDSAGAAITGSACVGEGGYFDIRPGAQVVVYDSSGAVLGASALQAGFHEPGACVFRFSVADVPRGGGVYQVEVSSRGKVVVREDAASMGLTSLTLG